MCYRYILLLQTKWIVDHIICLIKSLALGLGLINLLYKAYYAYRPELKPVEREVEVVLKFPEVFKLSPPIVVLS
jgi:hypothetical protein